MSTNTETRLTGAENVIWDLSDLYPSAPATALQHDLDTIVDRTNAFRNTWTGTLAASTNEQFATMMAEFEILLEILDRMGSYAHLQWSTNTDNPASGALLQLIRETSSRAWHWLVWVSVEMCSLSDERLASLANSPLLSRFKHWIESTAEYKKHILSEEIEQVLSERSLTSRFAWVRLHDELRNAQMFTIRGQEYTEAAILKLLHNSDRTIRKEAAEVFTASLKAGAKTQSFIFNTVMADCLMNDTIRKYPTWVSSRNLANEVSDATVQTLVNSVVDRFDLVARYYNLKKKLLGVDVMYDYDRYAPVSKVPSFVSWEEAQKIVVNAYTSFHPRVGEIASMFFEKPWIHAPVQPGKNGGAYSAGTVPSAHPYVFLNYLGTNRDVQVVAHELGHGIHQYLSRPHGMLGADTPLTIAETASVFGEMLVFKSLLEKTSTKEERLSLIMDKIDDIVSTVFRQVSLNRFEDAMHTARRTRGELSVEHLNEIWLETQTFAFRGSVTFTEGYRYSWSYISHFIHTPGYVYAYAFGELLVLALYEIYLRDGADFPEKYIALLSSGGSKRPEELLAPLGIDINDPSFWNIGLNAIERLLVEAESLAS
ncbi:M3 family oligoendopeptidase [soil metagenome]